MLYRGMDRAQLDAAYNNTAAVRERDALFADWAVRSEKVRQQRPGHSDLNYGDSPRERRRPIHVPRVDRCAGRSA